jgi:hypothetical protein
MLQHSVGQALQSDSFELFNWLLKCSPSGRIAVVGMFDFSPGTFAS